MTRFWIAGSAVVVVATLLVTRPFAAAPQDIVVTATSFHETHGNWVLVASPSSPDGAALASEDRGWSTRATALAEPADYVEAEFRADANIPYRVWLRIRAAADSKWNDSVWVQFNDALDETGAPLYASGSTDALLVNLESCYACGDRGWGWQDRAWWTGQAAVVQFATAGPHTIRIQTREDGVVIDQVVLSPVTFLEEAPGGERDDDTILSTTPAAGDVPAGVSTAAAPGRGSTGAGPGRRASAPGPTANPAPAASPAPTPAPGPDATQPARDATQQRAATEVAALAWNVSIVKQHEAGARTEMNAIASLQPRPRVLVFEEARGSLYSAYVGELQARTGRAWNGIFQGHCAKGAWDDTSGTCRSVEDEGVMVLSDYPVTGRETKLLPPSDCWHSARAAVHAVLDVEGHPLHVYGTHLQTGDCSDVTAARLNAIAALKMWVSRSPGPAVVASDFNEVPGAPEFVDPGGGMLSAFADAWMVAGSGPGLTYPVPSPEMRLDYWFVQKSGKVTVTSARVETSAGESDHYPVFVQFRLQR